MAPASFIAGFVAASPPVGLGNVGAYASRVDRLDIVVPAASLDTTVHEADAVLRADDNQADVETSAAPVWLDEDEWDANLLNPYTVGIFAGLLALGALTVLLADRTAPADPRTSKYRPLRARISSRIRQW